MIDTRAINVAPVIDVAHTVVEAVEPINVDTVIVDGRILKRHGKLTAIDITRVAAEATALRAEFAKEPAIRSPDSVESPRPRLPVLDGCGNRTSEGRFVTVGRSN